MAMVRHDVATIKMTGMVGGVIVDEGEEGGGGGSVKGWSVVICLHPSHSFRIAHS